MLSTSYEWAVTFDVVFSSQGSSESDDSTIFATSIEEALTDEALTDAIQSDVGVAAEIIDTSILVVVDSTPTTAPSPGNGGGGGGGGGGMNAAQLGIYVGAAFVAVLLLFGAACIFRRRQMKTHGQRGASDETQPSTVSEQRMNNKDEKGMKGQVPRHIAKAEAYNSRSSTKKKMKPSPRNSRTTQL